MRLYSSDHRKVPLAPLLIALLALILSMPGVAQFVDEEPGAEDPVLKLDPKELPGLTESVRVRRDANNIAHVFALNDHDAIFMLGYLHATDRFFQMDSSRRLFSGTLAELLGPAAVSSDVQFRTLGLRRAAEASLAVLTEGGREWIDAYVEGVNAYLEGADPLPFEYQVLELDRDGIPAWTDLDTLTVVKGIALGLSFDLEDLDYTAALLAFQTVGAEVGFDGVSLFFEDLYRTAPFDPSISIPPSANTPGQNVGGKAFGDALRPKNQLPSYLGSKAAGLIERYRQQVASTPVLDKALQTRDEPVGSNWWIADGSLTESGYPLFANDPHLALNAPSTFYEVHLRVRANGHEPLNVIGVSFPGTPAMVLGCNPWLCWGGTVNSIDETDVYLERLQIDPVTFTPIGTIFEGQVEPVVLIPQSFLFNQVGDGQINNLQDAGLGPLDGGLTIVVPRRNNGPILTIDASDLQNIQGISVQYTGWGPTEEMEAFRGYARARTLEQFRDAVQYFDVGSQNWGVADIRGNIGYFTSAELPIREDLQLLNMPDGGIPPYILRDGTHTLQHEWMAVTNPQPNQATPFEILPFDEMPQEVNPDRGYILNANNDPVGTSLDNNPLNQLRPEGGLYYLSPGYATGFRMGRLQRLFDEALASGEKLTVDDFKAFQSNNQLLDAEVLVPYILRAFAAATADPPAVALNDFGADPRINEAIGRLSSWDFSTPTGIAQGFDPGDDPANLPQPVQAEIDASVAATIYSAWRGQFVQAVIDDTLDALGLGDFTPGSSLAMAAVRNLLDNFGSNQGVGASGVNFFAVDGLTPEVARDFKILDSLSQALDNLAGDTFADAFANSADQDDYRWGYLHRIVFDHPLGGPFNLPAAGGPDNVSAALAGFARSGGLGALDASAHSARADGVNEFMFGSGPARRFVGHMSPEGAELMQVTPGGQSGNVGDPFQADQLLLWLTNQYHPLHLTPDSVIDNSRTFQRFLPAGE